METQKKFFSIWLLATAILTAFLYGWDWLVLSRMQDYNTLILLYPNHIYDFHLQMANWWLVFAALIWALPFTILNFMNWDEKDQIIKLMFFFAWFFLLTHFVLFLAGPIINLGLICACTFFIGMLMDSTEWGDDSIIWTSGHILGFWTGILYSLIYGYQIGLLFGIIYGFVYIGGYYLAILAKITFSQKARQEWAEARQTY